MVYWLNFGVGACYQQIEIIDIIHLIFIISNYSQIKNCRKWIAKTRMASQGLFCSLYSSSFKIPSLQSDRWFFYSSNNGQNTHGTISAWGDKLDVLLKRCLRCLKVLSHTYMYKTILRNINHSLVIFIKDYCSYMCLYIIETFLFTQQYNVAGRSLICIQIIIIM